MRGVIAFCGPDPGALRGPGRHRDASVGPGGLVGGRDANHNGPGQEIDFFLETFVTCVEVPPGVIKQFQRTRLRKTSPLPRRHRPTGSSRGNLGLRTLGSQG